MLSSPPYIPAIPPLLMPKRLGKSVVRSGGKKKATQHDQLWIDPRDDDDKRKKKNQSRSNQA